MKTAVEWLLEMLEQEGRTDLIKQYHEKNRVYQRHRAELQRKKRNEERERVAREGGR